MKITKSRLRQIIQEELENIQEQDPDAEARKRERETAVGAAATDRTFRKMSPKRREALETKHQAAKDKKDDEIMAKSAAERADAARLADQRETASDWEKEQAMRDRPGEFTSSDIGGINVQGVSPDDYASGNFGTTSFDPDVEYATQAETEEEMKASFEKETGMSPGGLDRGERTDDLGDFKPSARVASKGKLTGRKVNKLWRSGAFGKYEGGAKGTDSHKRWRSTRRALNKGQERGQIALASALTKGGEGVDPKTGRLSTAQQLALKSVTGRTPSRALASSAPEAVPKVAAAPEVAAPAEEQPALAAVDTERIDRLTRSASELRRAEKASDLSPALWKRLDKLAKKMQKREQPDGTFLTRPEALESAIGTLGSQMHNTIAQLRNEPGRERMVAKRAAGAAKTRAAQAKFGAGEEERAMATGGLPFRESLDRLTKIVEEEFENVLDKKRSLNEDGGDALAALRGGSQGASYAGSPGDEAAALIRQAAEKDQKDLLAVATKTHSSKAIPWLKGKVQAQVAATPAKPAAKPVDDPAALQRQIAKAKVDCKGAKGIKISLCQQKIAGLERRLAKVSRAAGGGGGGQGSGRR